MRDKEHVQPIADRVALNLEIVFKTFPTNQNSARGIYDQYQVINDRSPENTGTPGTKSKILRNNLKILCHSICNWLSVDNVGPSHELIDTDERGDYIRMRVDCGVDAVWMHTYE